MLCDSFNPPEFHRDGQKMLCLVLLKNNEEKKKCSLQLCLCTHLYKSPFLKVIFKSSAASRTSLLLLVASHSCLWPTGHYILKSFRVHLLFKVFKGPQLPEWTCQGICDLSLIFATPSVPGPACGKVMHLSQQKNQ